MNLYLISQSENGGYDTYDSAVVAAPSEDVARNMDPRNGEPIVWGDRYSTWAYSVDAVKVEMIGKAAEGISQGVICASFNAG
jgi:hypothetical protein